MLCTVMHIVSSPYFLLQALMAYENDTIDSLRTVQGESAYPTFKNAGPEILEVVRQKLKDCTYAHYVDDA